MQAHLLVHVKKLINRNEGEEIIARRLWNDCPANVEMNQLDIIYNFIEMG